MGCVSHLQRRIVITRDGSIFVMAGGAISGRERFHSFPMHEKHLLAAVRYVELNPVRDRLVTQAGDWPWSSARTHLQGQGDRLVQVSAMLDRTGDWAAWLAQTDASERQDTLRQHTRTGRPLGNEAFMEMAEQLTGRSLKPARPGQKWRSGNEG
jgi:putative transposase